MRLSKFYYNYKKIIVSLTIEGEAAVLRALHIQKGVH